MNLVQRLRRIIAVLLICCAANSLLACAKPKFPTKGQEQAILNASSSKSALPRPDPGYIQWLVNQSMLKSAGQLSAQVSGSELLWRNNAGGRSEVLLKAAPNWLWLSARDQFSKPVPGLFRSLMQEKSLAQLASYGIQGLYLAASAEDASLWHSQNAADNTIANHGSAAALRLDSALGSESDFQRLAQTIEEAGLQLGGSILPAQTGMGADFFLQAQHVFGYGGLYAMLEAPKADWNKLPKAKGQWQGNVLDSASLDYFYAKGLLPARLKRDQLPFSDSLPEGGWAASGEIQGADGIRRRWLYRFSKYPLHPVLLWTDPSGQARQVISADIIRQTGLYGQSLNGLAFSALLGLEPSREPGPLGMAAEGKTPKNIQKIQKHFDADLLNPGLEALFTASREIHRYGGWAMQSEILPEELTPFLLAGPLDFCRLEIPPEALEAATDREDTRLLALHLRSLLALGGKQSRLVRGIPLVNSTVSDSKAESGPPGLKASSDLPLELSFRIALPGLAFFNPAELGRVDFLPESVKPASTSKKSASAEKMGDASLGKLLESRKNLGLALGQILAVWTPGLGPKASSKPGVIAVATQLPNGNLWLMAGNFSKRTATFSLKLPKTTKKTLDAATLAPIFGLLHDAANLEMQLDASQVRHVILQE